MAPPRHYFAISQVALWLPLLTFPLLKETFQLLGETHPLYLLAASHLHPQLVLKTYATATEG